MGIRPDPHSPDLWHLDCRPDGYRGRRLRESFRGTREAAEDYYRALMRLPPDAPKLAKAPTIKAIWPDYLRHCKMVMSPTTVRDMEACWHKHLADFFGAIQPKTLNRQLIEQYKERRLSAPRWGKIEYGTIKPRTVAKELNFLSALLAWATEADLCDPLTFKIQRFPAKLIRSPKARPLSFDQVDGILEHIEPQYRLLYLLMADAGLRASEALTLRREHVELARGLIFVLGKGRKERIVPIGTERLRDELARRLTKASDYLSANPRTGKPYCDIKKPLNKAARLAGIEKHVYQHLLRHSFGTNATIAGVTPPALQDMMGHASLETTRIYQNLAADYLQAQAAKLGDMVKRTSNHMDKQDACGNDME